MYAYVDIELSDGTRVGEGPLLAVTEWQSDDLLNRAGAFSFKVDAADPHIEYIQEDRIARCWIEENGEIREVGSGIITTIRNEIVAGRDVKEVSGHDLLWELTYRTLRKDFYVDAWVTPTEAYFLEIGDAPVAMPNAIDGNSATAHAALAFNSSAEIFHFVYVRGDYPMQGMDIQFDGTNGGDGDLFLQYFAGESNGWKQLTPESHNLVDGTATSPDHTLSQDGQIVWTLPTDWVAGEFDGVYGYWLRFSVWGPDGAVAGNIEFEEIEVRERQGVTDILAQIVGFAPSGWTLSSTLPAYNSNGETTRVTATGDTLLAFLIRVADLYGHFFRKGVGREIEYLRDETPSSEIIAMSTADPLAVEDNPDVCLVTGLTITEEYRERYSRIIPYGPGQVDNRLTLEQVTDAVPGGYTLDVDSQGRYYLEHDATAAAIGVREFEKTIDVGQGMAGSIGANALLAAAKVELDPRLTGYIAYDLEVAKVDKPLRAGDTLDLIHYDAVPNDDGSLLVKHDINTIRDGVQLHVQGVTTVVDEQGWRVTGLEVATQRRKMPGLPDVLVLFQKKIAALETAAPRATAYAGELPRTEG